MKSFYNAIFILCILLLADSQMNAQILNGNLTLTTQEQVDNFNYTVVNGWLTIDDGGTGNITNLNGLSELTLVNAALVISNNSALTTLAGLSNLTYVGSMFMVNDNALLNNIDAVSSLTTIGMGLHLYNNPGLVSINGISNLTSLGSSIYYGYIYIGECDALESIDALTGITSVSGFVVLHGNDLLSNLDGLSNLTFIGVCIKIFDNPALTNLDGLSNAASVGSLREFYNMDDYSFFYWNTSLTSYCGLYKLFSENGYYGPPMEFMGNAYDPTIADILAAGPCEFNIEEGFDDLISEITELPISSNDITALTQKLVQAEAKYNAGKYRPALNILNAFINNVNLLIADNILTQEEGDNLLEYANDLIEAINSILAKINPGENTIAVQNSYTLNQNFPNPFNPLTVIKYQIPAAGLVTLRVYDALGKEIAVLVNEIQAEGTYETEFNASALPSGVYFYRIQSGTYSDTRKMILLK